MSCTAISTRPVAKAPSSSRPAVPAKPCSSPAPPRNCARTPNTRRTSCPSGSWKKATRPTTSASSGLRRFSISSSRSNPPPPTSRASYAGRGTISARWRPDLGAQAFGTLLDAADRLDRRLVLLVENFQNLCRDADDGFGWSLRAVLQNEPRIMLLASATTRFQEIRNAKEPFFELFRIVDLKPLDSAACLRLWSTVSGDVASERAIRPLEIFTGGSPRLLVIVAEFARHRSLPRLMEELVTLVDNHTEYFRGHLEHLPRGERRVYVAIIDLWQPSGAGEIAQRARMDVRPASTCIGRLLARGLISAQGTGRRKRYVATERLDSIYYKLRRERDEAAIICNLIRFMMAFYSTDDLMGMSDAVATYDAVWHRYGDCGIPEVQVTLAGILFNRAVGLRKMDDHQVAIDAYEVLDHTFGDSPDPEIQCWVAQGLVNLGVALSQDADDTPCHPHIRPSRRSLCRDRRAALSPAGGDGAPEPWGRATTARRPRVRHRHVG